MKKYSLGDLESAYASYQEVWSDEKKQVRNQSFYMRYCGIERCLPGHGYGPAKRDCYLIHFIMDGHGVYDFNDRVFHLEKGQAFLIYPGAKVYYQADMASPWKYCWIAFDGQSAEKIAESLGFSREMPINTFSDVDSIEQDISYIISRRGQECSDLLRREAGFIHLMANLLEQGEKRVLSAEEKSGTAELQLGSKMYTAEAVHYLEQHFREKIRIRQLAQEIGISRSYLTQQFKEEIGMSPRELLINIRMEHAVVMLEKTKDPIQLVALESGYDDALAFSKAFKARYGMSPTRYRQRKQQGATE